ncbi:MAG: type II secretion system GspH family protein [Culturomica sp.]|jgi:type IV pilus assembly protein PilE|nr:type II secretion system GspH family protein [Culturomica sp.]
MKHKLPVTENGSRQRKAGRLNAFSLPELLVVLVIIGILVLIALPNLMPLITKAKATEAQQQLVFLHTLQKTHFYTHSRYSTSLKDLGFEQQKLVTDQGNANYRIEIAEANEKGFRATATAVVDFDGDGAFNVWEINQEKELKETTQD